MQSLRGEFEFFVAGVVAGGPAEGSFFEALGGDPEAGAIEVEELESVTAFVDEGKELPEKIKVSAAKSEESKVVEE